MIQKLKTTLHKIVYAKNRKYLENFWSSAGERKSNWAQSYQDSWKSPLRQSVVSAVSSTMPNSILELGCNAGPNIIAIMNQLPNPPKIHGIDINDSALQTATAFFKKEGWTNISTERGILPEALQKIPDASYDTVMAVAVLMHLAPDSFEATVKEAQRIAKKQLVFVEIHTFSNFFNAEQKKLPSSYFVERWERNWWNVLDRTAWDVKIQELNPESTMAGEGDVNAIVIATRK